MGLGRIVAAGTLIGVVVVAFSYGFSGDPARVAGQYVGGAIGGTVLVYLVARSRRWIR